MYTRGFTFRLGLLYLQISGEAITFSAVLKLNCSSRGMSRDENEYPYPDEFDPSRWLNDKKPLDPRGFVFGYGRRICPGMHVAQASVWIAIASVLATFSIKKVKNSMGEDITPPLEFESGLARYDLSYDGPTRRNSYHYLNSPPKPFACDLKPRSEKAVHLIRDSVTNGREL